MAIDFDHVFNKHFGEPSKLQAHYDYHFFPNSPFPWLLSEDNNPWFRIFCEIMYVKEPGF